MADIFASVPGQVAYVEMPATLGKASIPAQIKNPAFIESRPAPIIVGVVDWTQKTHQQFATSLDGSIYVYVFGDMMGTLAIRGYAFDSLCNNEVNGLQKVLQYYADNRASKRATPIAIEIASKVIDGFLIGASVVARGSASDPAPVLNEYTLEISALP